MFISSLDLTGEVPFDIIRGDGEVIVRAPFGYDDEQGVVYSVFVAMAPLIGYADIPGYELTFNVVEAATDGSHAREYWDGRDTKAFLVEPALRRQVRILIYRVTETLIDDANPGLVHMTTHTAYLPTAALVKYDEICAIFRTKGFDARKADSWHGRHIWLMTR